MDAGSPELVLMAVVVVLAALGLRIVLRARRDGDLAEVYIGLFFVGLGCEVAGYGVSTAPPGLANGLSITLSSAALLAFTRRVFRRDAAWARWLAIGLGTAVALVFLTPHLAGGPTPGWRLAWSATRGAALGWAFLECALYYGAMRRRARLGLADPVLANRFLLWSLWTGCAALLPLTGLAMRILVRVGAMRDYTLSRELDPGMLGFAALIFGYLLVAAVSLWLSFFPPARYRAWLARSAMSQPA